MRFSIALAVAVSAGLVLSSAAAAHVTLNPREWEAGGFARFDVRVPNERPNAGTTEITVQFPEGLEFVSFGDVPGWERTIEMVELDEPIEGEEGEEPITERIGSVTWSGGEVEPGEFVEFPVSFRVPEEAGTELLFPAIQTYSNGEVVRWIDEDPEGDEPAPRVAVLAAEAEEETAAAADSSAAAGGGEESDDDSTATLALVFGIAGLAAGLLALAVAFLRPRRAERTQ